MKQQQGSHRISPGIIAAISAAVVAVAGGVAFFSWKSAHNPPAPIPQARETQPPRSSNQFNLERNAQIFWLQNTGTGFKLVPQTVQVKAGGNSSNQILEGAFQQLLAGPTESTESTTIPKQTKLLGIKVTNDGIHVNLSEEFTTGGGSSSMIGRVGQVIYTATALENNAKVYIEVNGKPLDVLGGEGLELEQPLTRESFNQNYSL